MYGILYYRSPWLSLVVVCLGLPPLYIQVGTAEVPLDDGRGLADAARAAGVAAKLDVWEGMVHVWRNNGAGMPEGTQAVEKIGAWLRKTVG